MARPRTGFSLVEVLAVLVILGLVAGVAAWSWRGARQALTLTDAIEQLRFAEQLAREQAQRRGQAAQLVFDLNADRLGVLDAETQKSRGTGLVFPPSCRIAQLRIAGQEQAITSGQVALPCSRRGQTPSYGLILAGRGTERRWLVICGLSGQVTEVDGEQSLKAMLSRLD